MKTLLIKIPSNKIETINNHNYLNQKNILPLIKHCNINIVIEISDIESANNLIEEINKIKNNIYYSSTCSDKIREKIACDGCNKIVDIDELMTCCGSIYKDEEKIKDSDKLCFNDQWYCPKCLTEGFCEKCHKLLPRTLIEEADQYFT